VWKFYKKMMGNCEGEVEVGKDCGLIFDIKEVGRGADKGVSWEWQKQEVFASQITKQRAMFAISVGYFNKGFFFFFSL